MEEIAKRNYNIDNGRTLCVPCHELTDNYKGKANKKLCSKK